MLGGILLFLLHKYDINDLNPLNKTGWETFLTDREERIRTCELVLLELMTFSSEKRTILFIVSTNEYI